MKLIVSALLLSSAFATWGVDYSTPQSLETHQCWKNNGVGFAIPRAYKSYGVFDSNAVSNVQNARAAGIEYVDIYMFPCRGRSATYQVNDLVGNMAGQNYGMIWIDAESNPSDGCSWNDYSSDSNCDYIAELVQAIRNQG